MSDKPKITRRFFLFLFLLLTAVTFNFLGPGQVSEAQAITPVYGWSWPTGMKLNNAVNDIEIDSGGNLYVGGQFTDAGGDPDADGIAYWNGANWSWPAGVGLLGLDKWVNDIEIDGSGNLYVGGPFLDAGGDSDADHIAYWDGANWSWPTGMGLSSDVFEIEIDSGGNLYVGGSFYYAPGDPDASYIAYWNGANWSWPAGMGLSSGVTDIEIDGSGNLYVGGGFLDAGGDPDADLIAYWDGANWSWPTGMGIPNTYVSDIEIDGSGNLYVGGRFRNAGGDPDANGIAYWNGANWSWPSGSSLSSVVKDIEINNNGEILVVGTFFAAGGDPDADFIAVWTDAPQILSTTLSTTTTITIAFSEDVFDPAGDSNSEDVTNPTNYLAFSDGGDSSLDTTSCPTVSGADTAITISSVAYNSGTKTATLSLGSTLTPGQTYGLIVCGSSGIVDKWGFSLAGDGLASGTDHIATVLIMPTPTPTSTTTNTPTTTLTSTTTLTPAITNTPTTPAPTSAPTASKTPTPVPSSTIFIPSETPTLVAPFKTLTALAQNTLAPTENAIPTISSQITPTPTNSQENSPILQSPTPESSKPSQDNANSNDQDTPNKITIPWYIWFFGCMALSTLTVASLVLQRKVS